MIRNVLCSFLLLTFGIGNTQAQASNNITHLDSLLSGFAYANIIRTVDADHYKPQDLAIAFLYKHIALKNLLHNGLADNLLNETKQNYNKPPHVNELINLVSEGVYKDTSILYVPEYKNLKFHILAELFLNDKISEKDILDFSNRNDLKSQFNFIKSFKELIASNRTTNRLHTLALARSFCQNASQNGFEFSPQNIFSLRRYASLSRNSQISESLYFKAKEMSEHISFSKDHSMIYAKSCQYLGNHFRRQGKQEKSLSFLNQYLQITKKHAAFNQIPYVDKNDLTYFVMGQTYSDAQNCEEAIKYFEQAIDCSDARKLSLKTQVQNLFFYSSGKAVCLNRKKEYQKTLDLMLPLYKRLEEVDGTDFIWIPEVYVVIAKAYRGISQFDEAKKYYIKCFEALGIKYLKEFEGSHDLSQSLGNLFSMSQNIMHHLPIEERIKHNNYTLEFLNHITNNFKNYENQKKVLIKADKWFDKELFYFSQKWRSNPNEIILDHILKLAHFNKSLVAISENLSKTEYALRETLRLEIDSLEKEIVLYKNNDASKLKELESLQYQYAIVSEPSIANLNKNEKSFYQLIEQKTRDRYLYINYIELDSNYLRISYKESDWKISLLPNSPEINNLIDDFRSSIYSPYLSCQKDKIDFKKADSKSKELGVKLFGLLFKHIILDDINGLIIHPDSKINLVPFDALSHPKTNQYLVRNLSISYANPMHFDKLTKNKAHVGNAHLFAPQFINPADTICNIEKNRENYLGELFYNQKEIEAIHAIIPSSSYLNKEASKAHFVSIIKNAGLLHLATHSKVNISHNDYSFVAFQESGNIKDDRFYLNELNNYKLNAQCVVLSSCDSGVGDYVEGIGINSIANSFLSAGAKSVVSSLWSVNDQSTSMIMKAFYSNLKEGLPLDVSLQKAKVHYLENIDPIYQSPFYWGGFTLNGQADPIKFERSNPTKIYLLILVLILVGLFLNRKYF